MKRPIPAAFKPRNVSRQLPSSRQASERDGNGPTPSHEEGVAPAAEANALLGPRVPLLRPVYSVNDFEVLDQIGKGEFGVVRRARMKAVLTDGANAGSISGGCSRDGAASEVICLKELAFDYDKEGFPLEALRELGLLSALSPHPNLVRPLAVAVGGSGLSAWHLAMEAMDCDLATLILGAKRMPFSEAQVKDLAQQMLQALAHCHARGVMHRDLKPQNVLVSAKGVLKLCDFGLARVLKAAPPPVATLSATTTAADESHSVENAPRMSQKSSHGDENAAAWGLPDFEVDVLPFEPLREGSVLGPSSPCSAINSVLFPNGSGASTVSESTATIATTPLDGPPSSATAGPATASAPTPAAVTTPRDKWDDASDDEAESTVGVVAGARNSEPTPPAPHASNSYSAQQPSDKVTAVASSSGETSEATVATVYDQKHGPELKESEKEAGSTESASASSSLDHLPPIRADAPPGTSHTPRVVSGHYRPPEVLFGARDYTEAVDLWSCGCIFAELLARKVLFDGDSEPAQLKLIFATLGSPPAPGSPYWQSIAKRALAGGFKFPPPPPAPPSPAPSTTNTAAADSSSALPSPRLPPSSTSAPTPSAPPANATVPTAAPASAAPTSAVEKSANTSTGDAEDDLLQELLFGDEQEDKSASTTMEEATADAPTPPDAARPGTIARPMDTEEGGGPDNSESSSSSSTSVPDDNKSAEAEAVSVEALAAQSRAAAEAQARSQEAAWTARWAGLRAKCPAKGFDPRDVHGRCDPSDPAALSDAGFKVLAGMLEVDPKARLAARQLLELHWFQPACAPKAQRLDEASVSIARRGAEAVKRQREKEKQQQQQEQMLQQMAQSVGGHFPGGVPQSAAHQAALAQAQALAAAQMRAPGSAPMGAMPMGVGGGFPAGFPGGFPGGVGGQVLGGWGLPHGMHVPPSMPPGLRAAMGAPSQPQPTAAASVGSGGALAAAQAQAVALAQARAKALGSSMQFNGSGR